jgi:ubiquinone/menaquinone biosynthesis C-methylase UbiE
MGTSRLFRGSADAYDRFVGRYGPNLSRELITAAGVRQGQRVLDVGCGPGPLTTALAALVGADRVSAVDPSEPFAQACRERVPGADVRVAAAEELPFEDDTFDATLSQLVVNFVDDAPRGLGEMRRVTRPDGIVAGCTWDYAGGMTMLRAFWDAARSLDSSASDEGATMRFSDPESLGELWRGAGLRDVQVSELVADASYEDFDDLWEPFLAGIGPAGAHAVSLEPEAQAALRGEFARRLGRPDGPFTLTAQAWCAVGTVPD